MGSSSQSEEIRLSYSKLDTLSRCPQQFYRRYVLKEPDVLGAPMILGRAFHFALQKNFEHKQVHGVDLGKNEVAKIYRDSFADEANKPVFKDLETLTEDQIDWGKEDPKDLRQQGQKALLRYHRDHAPFLEPLMIEERIEKKIGNVTLVGILDLVTTQGVVIDFKLTGYPWPQGQVDFALQPTVYATLLGQPITFDFHFITRAKERVGISIRRTGRLTSDINWLTQVHLPQSVELINQMLWIRSPGQQCQRCAYQLGCGYRA